MASRAGDPQVPSGTPRSENHQTLVQVAGGGSTHPGSIQTVNGTIEIN